MILMQTLKWWLKEFQATKSIPVNKTQGSSDDWNF